MECPYPSQDDLNFLAPTPPRSESGVSTCNTWDIGSPDMSIRSTTPLPYGMPQAYATSQSASMAYAGATNSREPVTVEFIDYSASSSGADDKPSKKSVTRNGNLRTTNMHQRRREQNRASQRAFRERKEKHVKGLQDQLESLQEKHQSLVQSYSQQANKVVELNERIGELTQEINVLRRPYNEAPASFANGCDGLPLPGEFGDISATDFLLTEADACYGENGNLGLNLGQL
ncbi:hypothetical protein FQN54_009140 [Arachnomyces sp. PD_36]|nr:hypothetical protein FQN54_009140 [Arachnomyces sp. PD_36]